MTEARPSPFDIVALGCSWGGVDALATLLPAFPADFPAAIVVAQHRQPDAPGMAKPMSRRAVLPVSEADDKEPILPGHIYLAPSDYHLLVEPGNFALSTEEAVLFARPSIDVLFESVADSYGSRGIGVILTGANEDGASGLAAIKQRGGLTVAQEPEGAVRREMPDAAIATGAVDKVLALEEIAGFLIESCDQQASPATGGKYGVGA